MSAMSDYLETALINHLFRGTAYTAPASLGIALCTAAVVDSDTTLAGKELAASGTIGYGYARQTFGPAAASWGPTVGGNGTTSNLNSIVFPTATSDWGTITYVAICDSTTTQSGNLLFYGSLASNKVVLNGDTFQFNANQLTVQIDN